MTAAPVFLFVSVRILRGDLGDGDLKLAVSVGLLTGITLLITGLLVVGGSVGGMIVPMIVGQLFEPFGPLVMMYTILVDLALALLVYIVMVGYRSRELAASTAS